MNLAGFEKIAPYLGNPLILVGFVLMLAYGIHWQLMKSGLLRQVSQKDSSLIIRLFLRYGFWLALVLLLAGVGLQFSDRALVAWNSYMDKEKVIAVNAGKMAEKLYAQLDTKDQQLGVKDEQIKALTETIQALTKANAPAKNINLALRALEQGNTKQAKAIFAQVLQSKEAEGRKANKEAAAAARHLGTLAYMNSPQEALVHYRKAVQLDPDNMDSWNQLGHLFDRAGKLAQAEEIYRKVLALAEAHHDNEWRAKAIGNLGNVYLTRGELDRAKEMYEKSLAIHTDSENKKGLASCYGNLGLVYQAYGDLKRAEEMHRKALAFYIDLVNSTNKKSMRNHIANQYVNLGIVYRKRGKLDKAEEMYRKALAIDEAEDSNNKEGIASDYANLGIIYQIRGDLKQAEEMHRKALAIDSSLGHMEGMTSHYGNLGNVYKTRGKLDKAEEMYQKSLEISEALDMKEASANQYANLGVVYEKRGDLRQAEDQWKKSLILYQAMGHRNTEMIQQWLDTLAQERSAATQ
ncbi:MAG: tetratricopeptide repeat protein [Candidatus Electrothrix sp. AW3_4]|nr:tetratricopeptide repeat protein [Candidatus Electrothrix gigas]